jgi:hypothetical protein
MISKSLRASVITVQNPAQVIVGSLSGSRLKSVRFLVGEISGAVASYGAVKIIKINH